MFYHWAAAMILLFYGHHKLWFIVSCNHYRCLGSLLEVIWVWGEHRMLFLQAYCTSRYRRLWNCLASIFITCEGLLSLILVSSHWWPWSSLSWNLFVYISLIFYDCALAQVHLRAFLAAIICHPITHLCSLISTATQSTFLKVTGHHITVQVLIWRSI